MHSLPNSDHQLLCVSRSLGILIERDHLDELSNLLGVVVVVCYQRANELGMAIPGHNQAHLARARCRILGEFSRAMDVNPPPITEKRKCAVTSHQIAAFKRLIFARTEI